MNKLNLNAYKYAYERVFENITNQQTVANAGGSAGSQTPDHLIKSHVTLQLYQLLTDQL